MTHYKDIEKLIGKSRKTVNKYLNHIASEVIEYQVRLVRKRNVGIYFEGDTQHLQSAIQSGKIEPAKQNSEQIKSSILVDFLTSNVPMKVDDLSDKYFVSRSTLETYIKDLRSNIENYGATFKSSQSGLYIETTEKNKRKLMSLLLENYWGDNGYRLITTSEKNIKINIPHELKNLFNQDFFEKVQNTLVEFQNISKLGLNDYEYQSLMIHLVIAIQRIKKGETLTSEIGDSSQSLSKNTRILTFMLEKNLKMKIPFNEEKYINIHILAAESSEMDYDSDTEFNGTDGGVIGPFLKASLQDYDEVLIHDLILHLIPALHRFALGLSINNPYTNEVKRIFPYAYNLAVNLSLQIEKEFGVNVNEDEIAFIALHLETYIEREKQKLSAVIVCSTGLGTARLLEQRIHKFFADTLEIKRVISVAELKRNVVTESLVISTVALNMPGKKVVIVSPFLDDNSKNKIQNVMIDSTKNKVSREEFMDLINENLIIIDSGKKEKEQVIERISSLLQEQGFASKGIGDAAIAREKLASTEMDFVAMPHAPIEFVKNPCIAIYINPQGVEWSKGKVNIVFFFSMNESIKTSIDEIYSYFNELLEDKQLLQRITHQRDKNNVIKMLGSEIDV